MRTSLVASWLVVTFAGGLVVGNAAGPARPRMWADTVLDVVTGELPRSARVRANVNNWDPGSETGRHTDPGPTVFVMLEGELEEILPDGTTRPLTEPTGEYPPSPTPRPAVTAGARKNASAASWTVRA